MGIFKRLRAGSSSQTASPAPVATQPPHPPSAREVDSTSLSASSTSSRSRGARPGLPKSASSNFLLGSSYSSRRAPGPITGAGGGGVIPSTPSTPSLLSSSTNGPAPSPAASTSRQSRPGLPWKKDKSRRDLQEGAMDQVRPSGSPSRHARSHSQPLAKLPALVAANALGRSATPVPNIDSSGASPLLPAPELGLGLGLDSTPGSISAVTLSESLASTPTMPVAPVPTSPSSTRASADDRRRSRASRASAGSELWRQEGGILGKLEFETVDAEWDFEPSSAVGSSSIALHSDNAETESPLATSEEQVRGGQRSRENGKEEQQGQRPREGAGQVLTLVEPNIGNIQSLSRTAAVPQKGPLTDQQPLSPSTPVGATFSDEAVEEIRSIVTSSPGRASGAGQDVVDGASDQKKGFWKAKIRPRRGSVAASDIERPDSPPVRPSPPVSTQNTAARPAQVRRPSSSLFHIPFHRSASRVSLQHDLDVRPSVDDGSFQLRSFRHVSGASDAERPATIATSDWAGPPPVLAAAAQISSRSPSLPQRGFSQDDANGYAPYGSMVNSPEINQYQPPGAGGAGGANWSPPPRVRPSRPPSAAASVTSVDEVILASNRVSVAAFRRGIRRPSEVFSDSGHTGTGAIERQASGMEGDDSVDNVDDEDEDDMPLAAAMARAQLREQGRSKSALSLSSSIRDDKGDSVQPSHRQSKSIQRTRSPLQSSQGSVVPTSLPPPPRGPSPSPVLVFTVHRKRDTAAGPASTAGNFVVKGASTTRVGDAPNAREIIGDSQLTQAAQPTQLQVQTSSLRLGASTDQLVASPSELGVEDYFASRPSSSRLDPDSRPMSTIPPSPSSPVRSPGQRLTSTTTPPVTQAHGPVAPSPPPPAPIPVPEPQERAENLNLPPRPDEMPDETIPPSSPPLAPRSPPLPSLPSSSILGPLSPTLTKPLALLDEPLRRISGFWSAPQAHNEDGFDPAVVVASMAAYGGDGEILVPPPMIDPDEVDDERGQQNDRARGASGNVVMPEGPTSLESSSQHAGAPRPSLQARLRLASTLPTSPAQPISGVPFPVTLAPPPALSHDETHGTAVSDDDRTTERVRSPVSSSDRTASPSSPRFRALSAASSSSAGNIPRSSFARAAAAPGARQKTREKGGKSRSRTRWASSSDEEKGEGAAGRRKGATSSAGAGGKENLRGPSKEKEREVEKPPRERPNSIVGRPVGPRDAPRQTRSVVVDGKNQAVERLDNGLNGKDESEDESLAAVQMRSSVHLNTVDDPGSMTIALSALSRRAELAAKVTPPLSSVPGLEGNESTPKPSITDRSRAMSARSDVAARPAPTGQTTLPRVAAPAVAAVATTTDRPSESPASSLSGYTGSTSVPQPTTPRSSVERATSSDRSRDIQPDGARPTSAVPGPERKKAVPTGGSAAVDPKPRERSQQRQEVGMDRTRSASALEVRRDTTAPLNAAYDQGGAQGTPAVPGMYDGYAAQVQAEVMRQQWQAQYMAAASRYFDDYWERASSVSTSHPHVTPVPPAPPLPGFGGMYPPVSFPFNPNPFGYPSPHASASPPSPLYAQPQHMPMPMHEAMYAYAAAPQSVYGDHFGPPVPFSPMGFHMPQSQPGHFGSPQTGTQHLPFTFHTLPTSFNIHPSHSHSHARSQSQHSVNDIHDFHAQSHAYPNGQPIQHQQQHQHQHQHQHQYPYQHQHHEQQHQHDQKPPPSVPPSRQQGFYSHARSQSGSTMFHQTPNGPVSPPAGQRETLASVEHSTARKMSGQEASQNRRRSEYAS